MDKIFTQYKQLFDRFVPLSPEEWAFFKSKSRLQHFKKGEVIHRAGDVCKQLLFVNYGVIRSYIIDNEGKDYTWSISFNDKNSQVNHVFVVDYASFVNNEASQLNFEVLEDCQVLSIHYDDLQEVYHHSKNGERFGRLMAEKVYSSAHKLIINRLTKSASTRYKELIKDSPYLLEMVSQNHLATFLGITPQSLSRIRKEITLCE